MTGAARWQRPLALPHVPQQVWRLYRFRGVGEKLYIGQTRQEALARLLQHVRTQWWAVMIESWDVDPRLFYSKDDVLAAECQAIWAERPRCNDQHNRRNPGRWESMADVPQHLRPAGPHPVEVRRERRPYGRPVSVPARRRLTPWQWHALGVAGAWLVCTIALWWAIAGHVPVWTGAWESALVMGVLAVAAWSKTRPRRRRRRW